MNKLGILALAANFAPRIFRVRRATWISIGIGFLVLTGLMLWAAIALAGWFWGQAGKQLEAAPALAQGAMKQLDQAIPEVRGILEIIVPSLKLPPASSLSTDQQQHRKTGIVVAPSAEQ
jgi:hypothetical protein